MPIQSQISKYTSGSETDQPVGSGYNIMRGNDTILEGSRQLHIDRFNRLNLLPVVDWNIHFFESKVIIWYKKNWYKMYSVLRCLDVSPLLSILSVPSKIMTPSPYSSDTIHFQFPFLKSSDTVQFCLTLTLSRYKTFWHFQDFKSSGAISFFLNSDTPVLTFSDSDTFRFHKIMTLSRSDTFRFDISNFWHLPKIEDSDTFRFWHVQIMKYCCNLWFWHLPDFGNSDTLRLWHAQILTCSDFNTFRIGITIDVSQCFGSPQKS